MILKGSIEPGNVYTEIGRSQAVNRSVVSYLKVRVFCLIA